jgi:hypothetical protein
MSRSFDRKKNTARGYPPASFHVPVFASHVAVVLPYVQRGNAHAASHGSPSLGAFVGHATSYEGDTSDQSYELQCKTRFSVPDGRCEHVSAYVHVALALHQSPSRGVLVGQSLAVVPAPHGLSPSRRRHLPSVHEKRPHASSSQVVGAPHASPSRTELGHARRAGAPPLVPP